jgi:hypothetical protein
VKDNLQILKRPKEEHISMSHDSYHAKLPFYNNFLKKNIKKKLYLAFIASIRTKRSKIKVQLLTLQNNLFIQQGAQSEDLSSKFALL